ncbi:hypothetical protein N7520_008483 [Penicillium odoratum]|uniref:uncharacterized protein n=1 Tax=Penicillium odoratum TaxID=1167516 RepID=UPI002548B023|nr:uncharacterized protein N7520_008483 [Penicillium odoratum]KAJ5751566.1 hypothetical protein N7520_008483 [Penicillium odoratum]
MPVLTRLIDDIESEESEKKQLIERFQRIVGAIVLLAAPLPIQSLSRLLIVETQLLRTHLDSFRFVLSVPIANESDRPVRILHLSFRDFLVSSSDENFRVPAKTKNSEIAKLCFNMMKLHLKKNVCSLKSPAAKRANIDPQPIRYLFPAELSYACRYWGTHFEGGIISESEAAELLLFLKEYFLYWVEAMSLLGIAMETVGAQNSLELSAFLHDASRFVLRVRNVIDKTPLQLYCSALIFFIPGGSFDAETRNLSQVQEAYRFALHSKTGIEKYPLQVYNSALVFSPTSSITKIQFEKEGPVWLTAKSAMEENWNACLQTLEGHRDSVSSVVFSHDSKLLASASDDTTVKV